MDRERTPDRDRTLDEAAEAAHENGAGNEDGDECAGIEGEIVELRSELDELNAKWLRALADLENYRKRVERERLEWSRLAREDALVPFLEVVDNFERALSTDGVDADDSFRQGIELILKQLMGALEASGVTPIETAGAEFDPTVHEAVGSIPSEEHEANRIVEEVQRGYRLGDRLLRPSRVIVAKEN